MERVKIFADRLWNPKSWADTAWLIVLLTLVVLGLSYLMRNQPVPPRCIDEPDSPACRLAHP